MQHTVCFLLYIPTALNVSDILGCNTTCRSPPGPHWVHTWYIILRFANKYFGKGVKIQGPGHLRLISK